MEAGKSGKSPPRKAEAKPGKKDDRRQMRRWGLVTLAVLVGLIVWVATQGDNGDSAAPEPVAEGFAARIVSEAELGRIAASAGHSVYWAGPLTGKELEASESEDGSVRVRYLDEGAEPGGDPTGALTIGSYPLPDAAGALEGFAERQGSIARQASDGREVVFNLEAPSSVYFASPDGGVQVEIYDPSPKRAIGLALSGRVEPIEEER